MKTSLPPTCLPIIGPDAPKTILPLKKIKVILNRCYDKSIYTKNIKCDFGLISLTKEFRYSGSIILFDSNDYDDIRFRIKNESQAMEALKLFWDSDHVDVSAKVHIYLAIPINLLLWGYQT